VNKMEWRGYIKKIPGCEKQHYNKVDALFASLDADDSGSINMAEMEKAFDLWSKQAAAVTAEAEAIRADANPFHEAAAELREAARQTAEMESQESSLALLMAGEPTLAGRIGKVLSARNFKVGLVREPENRGGWDSNGDGCISKLEWRQVVRKLGSGLQATPDERLDALFDELDTDHGDSLDLKECEAALKRMIADTVKHQGDLTDQLVLVKAMVKPLKQVQQQAMQAWRKLGAPRAYAGVTGAKDVS